MNEFPNNNNPIYKLKLFHLNERIIELIDIAPKDFWGAQDSHLEMIKKYYPKLKIVARGTTLKAFGEKEVLDEFENRFNRLMLHFTRYNNIDDNVIERVIQSTVQEDNNSFGHDKILVHGVGGKIIKAMTPNQQLLVDTVNKNDMVFAVGPAGTGKTYTGVAMAVKALKEKQVKRIILTRPAVEAGKPVFLPARKNRWDSWNDIVKDYQQRSPGIISALQEAAAMALESEN